MYSQIHQEQIVAGMTTQHRVENPAVQEQVIVQEIPQAPQVQIVERIQEQIVEPIDVLAPAVTYAAPSQQLPSIIKAVATGVNLDMTGLVNPQFSIAGVEVSAPQAVGSLPHLQEFVAPMCNPVLQDKSLRQYSNMFSRNSRSSGCGADTGFTDDTQYELHVDQQRCACRDTCRDRSCYHR